MWAQSTVITLVELEIRSINFIMSYGDTSLVIISFSRYDMLPIPLPIAKNIPILFALWS